MSGSNVPFEPDIGIPSMLPEAAFRVGSSTTGVSAVTSPKLGLASIGGGM
jgi:hypothetical protein